jgi:hypothetical protein
MSFRLFDRGRQDIGTGTIVFGTTGLSMRAVSLSSASTNNLAIASSTNATPIVVTVSGTIPAGWAIGDIVVIRGHIPPTRPPTVHGFFRRLRPARPVRPLSKPSPRKAAPS